MTISAYIRPLVLSDALTSYAWRNDPMVWVYTGRKAGHHITPEIESDWLREQLSRENQDRFAICIKELDTYVGNIQLLDIKDKDAELHLFIGNRLFWGKKIGYQATVQIIQHGFIVRKLDTIHLKVHPSNIAALSLYERAGFHIIGRENDVIVMKIDRNTFLAS